MGSTDSSYAPPSPTSPFALPFAWTSPGFASTQPEDRGTASGLGAASRIQDTREADGSGLFGGPGSASHSFCMPASLLERMHTSPAASGHKAAAVYSLSAHGTPSRPAPASGFERSTAPPPSSLHDSAIGPSADSAMSEVALDEGPLRRALSLWGPLSSSAAAAAAISPFARDAAFEASSDLSRVGEDEEMAGPECATCAPRGHEAATPRSSRSPVVSAFSQCANASCVSCGQHSAAARLVAGGSSGSSSASSSNLDAHNPLVALAALTRRNSGSGSGNLNLTLSHSLSGELSMQVLVALSRMGSGCELLHGPAGMGRTGSCIWCAVAVQVDQLVGQVVTEFLHDTSDMELPMSAVA